MRFRSERQTYYAWRKRVLRKKMRAVKVPGEKGWGRRDSEKYTRLAKAYDEAGYKWFQAWSAGQRNNQTKD